MPRCCGQGSRRLLDDDLDSARRVDARGCTDCCCLLLLGLSVSLLALVAHVAEQIGDPSLIFFGTDHLGRQCGKAPLEIAPKLYFPRLSADLLEQRDKLSTPWALELYGVCVPDCPTRRGTSTEASPAYVSDLALGYRGQRWPVGEGTSDILNRCVPIEREPQSTTATYCAHPRCWEVQGAVCANEVPGHERQGLWRMGEGGADATYCVRELAITYTEASRVPNTHGLVSALARAAGGLSAAAEQIVISRAEVRLCSARAAVLPPLPDLSTHGSVHRSSSAASGWRLSPRSCGWSSSASLPQQPSGASYSVPAGSS